MFPLENQQIPGEAEGGRIPSWPARFFCRFVYKLFCYFWDATAGSKSKRFWMFSRGQNAVSKGSSKCIYERVANPWLLLTTSSKHSNENFARYEMQMHFNFGGIRSKFRRADRRVRAATAAVPMTHLENHCIFAGAQQNSC